MSKIGLKENEEIERFTKILRDKVTSKNGELILSLRRIVLKEGDGRGCIPQPHKICYHSEIGVIAGKIEQKTNRDIKTIDMSDIIHLWTPHTITTYRYSPEFVVPVRNKAIVQSSFNPCFNIANDKLRNIRGGEISFGSLEIVSSSNGYAITHPPYLSRLDVVVGDNEVVDFVKLENPFTKTDRLLEILKDEGGLRRHREDYENKKREDIQKDLTMCFSEIVSLNRDLTSIENDVLTARLEEYQLQDVREYGWTNANSVNRYFELEKEIKKEQSKIKTILENKESLELISRGSIKGGHIGFPAEIPAQQYLNYLRTKMTEIDTRINKINVHLREN